jgi:hypothetical protein
VGRASDAWLSPITLDPRQGETTEKQPTRRASNQGFLALELDEYLELLDWTGRQAQTGKRSSIPSHLQPILSRLQVSDELWLDTTLNFGRWFHRAAGRQENLSQEAARRGRQWLAGIRHSRKAFC